MELIAGKFAEYFIEKTVASVFRKLQAQRAQAFFDTFIDAVANGASEEEIQKKLDEILESESKSEVLFDAYRSVTLSKSKIIGPKAIGLLTARIIAENRDATSDEALWLEAYESLTDTELIQLSGYLEDAFAGRTFNYSRQNKAVYVKYPQSADTGPFDLQNQVGSWARKLHSLGILLLERKEPIAVLGDQPPDPEVTHFVVLKEKYQKYSSLIEKVIPGGE